MFPAEPLHDGGDINHESLHSAQLESALHQDVEQSHPGLSPHSCDLCRRVTIDLRRQLATEIFHAEEWKQQPKGWRTYPTELGWAFDAACAAAEAGCQFLEFVVREIRYESRFPDRPCPGSTEITVSGWMRGASGLWFSIQGRLGNRMTSLRLYTIPGTGPHGKIIQTKD